MRKLDFQIIRRRPLSATAAILALLLIIYEGIQISSGHLYQEFLNRMDGTTLIELAILTLLGVYTLRDHSDLQAVSFTLVAGLSFIFVYEAIYKWSFYLAPFGRPMPPAEIREFVIQTGIAATILTGFASGYFALRKWTLIWLGLFVILYAFWMCVGFPQITGETVFRQLIPIDFSYNMTYAVNRSTKFMIFMAYLTLFPPLRRSSENAIAVT